MDPSHETSPDQLLDTFRGRSLKTIILFTIAVHAVVLLGTSVPFLWRALAGNATANLSEDDRTGLAMKEATSALRKIAEAHNLRPQDLASRLDGAGPRAPRQEIPPAAPAAKPAADPSEPAPADPDKPKSEIEKDVEKVKEGPSTPPVEEEVDLFK